MGAVGTSPLEKEVISFSIPICVEMEGKTSKSQNEISKELGSNPNSSALIANLGESHTSFNFNLLTCKMKLIILILSILKWNCEENVKNDHEFFKITNYYIDLRYNYCGLNNYGNNNNNK